MYILIIAYFRKKIIIKATPVKKKFLSMLVNFILKVALFKQQFMGVAQLLSLTLGKQKYIGGMFKKK